MATVAKRPTPKHITEPRGAVALVAWHAKYDIAAWRFLSGVERLYINGVYRDITPHPAAQEVFAFNRMTDTQLRNTLRVMFRVGM